MFWVMASSSAVPAKHCWEVPGRRLSARSNTAFAAGLNPARDWPMPGYWAPWPENTKAILPMVFLRFCFGFIQLLQSFYYAILNGVTHTDLNVP